MVGYRVVDVYELTRKWLQLTEDEDSGYPAPRNVTISPVGVIVVGTTLTANAQSE